MLTYLRTLSARLITRWLRRPRALAVRAWFWFCAHADDLTKPLFDTPTGRMA